MFNNSTAAPRFSFQDAGQDDGPSPALLPAPEPSSLQHHLQHNTSSSSSPFIHPPHRHFKGQPLGQEEPKLGHQALLPRSRHFQQSWPSPPSLTPSPDPTGRQPKVAAASEEGDVSRHTSSASSDASSVASSLETGSLNRHFPQPLIRSSSQHRLQLPKSRRRPELRHHFRHRLASNQNAMAAADDWTMSDIDGIPDSYETKQLHNAYLAGTAGSPYSRTERNSLYQPPFPQAQRASNPMPDYDVNMQSSGALLGQQPLGLPSTSYSGFPAIADMAGPSLSMFPSCDGLPAMAAMPLNQQSAGDLYGCGISDGELSSGLTPFGSSSFSSASSAGSSQGNATPAPFLFDSQYRTQEPLGPRQWNNAMNGRGETNATLSPHDLPLKAEHPVEFTDAEIQAVPLFGDESGDVEVQMDEQQKQQQQQQQHGQRWQDTTLLDLSGDGAPPSSYPVPDTKEKKAKATKPKPTTQGRKTSKSSRKELPDKAPRPREAATAQPDAAATAAAAPAFEDPDTPPTAAPPSPVASAPEPKRRTSSSAQKLKSPQPRKVLRSPERSSARPFKPISDGAEPEPRQGGPKPPPPITLNNYAVLGDRASKDNFLVTSKRMGLTYREIREAGRFTEAESTLRGRYRTLTKSKEERVRRPEWTEQDIRLLRKATRKYTRRCESKIPWKKISQYIYDNGGSYLFGYGTCRKKWDELMKRGVIVEEEEEHEDEEDDDDHDELSEDED